jgi:hypothetical protein
MEAAIGFLRKLDKILTCNGCIIILYSYPSTIGRHGCRFVGFDPDRRVIILDDRDGAVGNCERAITDLMNT